MGQGGSGPVVMEATPHTCPGPSLWAPPPDATRRAGTATHLRLAVQGLGARTRLTPDSHQTPLLKAAQSAIDLHPAPSRLHFN